MKTFLVVNTAAMSYVVYADEMIDVLLQAKYQQDIICVIEITEPILPKEQ